MHPAVVILIVLVGIGFAAFGCMVVGILGLDFAAWCRRSQHPETPVRLPPPPQELEITVA